MYLLEAASGLASQATTYVVNAAPRQPGSVAFWSGVVWFVLLWIAAVVVAFIWRAIFPSHRPAAWERRATV